jgi:NAD(P)-dependent dehydrogenase (short-subunit alcohol dehydrogenase family)
VSKTILVTGGSRGIGGAVALEAASLGWAVAVGSRRTAQRPNPSSRRSRSEAAVPFPSSVTSRSRPTLCGFDEAEQALGALDGVVINAGIVAPSLPLAEMDEPRLRRMVEVNVLGTFVCACESVRRLGVAVVAVGARSCSSRPLRHASGTRRVRGLWGLEGSRRRSRHRAREGDRR